MPSIPIHSQEFGCHLCGTIKGREGILQRVGPVLRLSFAGARRTACSQVNSQCYVHRHMGIQPITSERWEILKGMLQGKHRGRG